MNYWSQLDFWGAFAYVAPFVVFLAMIAFMPVLPLRHWWESNRNKALLAVAAGLGGAALYVAPTGDWHKVLHTLLEYLSFVALIASLFIISGGIHVGGSLAGFPYVNTLFLALGAVLANLLGTTGASMLLLRPLIRANKARKHKTHIFVFFIFIVGNCGGLLTPLGDPPLFLGFLRGVPFGWTLGLLKQWALVNLFLLFAFHLVDEYYFVKEDLRRKSDLIEDSARGRKKVTVEGWANLGLILGVAACVAFSGVIGPMAVPWLGPASQEWTPQAFQILSLSFLAALSWGSTPAGIYRKNQFSSHPAVEVAVLFFGIFGAMLPALAVLEAKAPLLGLESAWQYYWATGLLSGLLDNAPTYLTFATLASAQAGLSGHGLGDLAAKEPLLLAAISCGAVFMGALTYVGNGPNFMIKAVVERAGIKMPGFGAYMLWAAVILGPPLLVCAMWFF